MVLNFLFSKKQTKKQLTGKKEEEFFEKMKSFKKGGKDFTSDCLEAK